MCEPQQCTGKAPRKRSNLRTMMSPSSISRSLGVCSPLTRLPSKRKRTWLGEYDLRWQKAFMICFTPQSAAQQVRRRPKGMCTARTRRCGEQACLAHGGGLLDLEVHLCLVLLSRERHRAPFQLLSSSALLLCPPRPPPEGAPWSHHRIERTVSLTFRLIESSFPPPSAFFSSSSAISAPLRVLPARTLHAANRSHCTPLLFSPSAASSLLVAPLCRRSLPLRRPWPAPACIALRSGSVGSISLLACAR